MLRAAAWVARRIMSRRFKAPLELDRELELSELDRELAIDSTTSIPVEDDGWEDGGLVPSSSFSLFEVGWQPDTSACRTFRPPSHPPRSSCHSVHGARHACRGPRQRAGAGQARS